MKKKYLYKLLRRSVELYEQFHENSKFVITSKLKKGRVPKRFTRINYKGYARFEEFKLPLPHLTSSLSFKSILKNRNSSRTFSQRKISLKELSTLLHYSAGIRDSKEKRFYPSAGTRYPLEIYIVSQNTSLPKGIYHYYVKTHTLEKIFELEENSLVNAFTHRWIEKAPCIVIITSIFRRSTEKYGNRGYRFILLEAGHLAQNISLLCSALHLSYCSVGGYVDDLLNKLLDLENHEESVIYVATLGKRLTTRQPISKI